MISYLFFFFEQLFAIFLHELQGNFLKLHGALSFCLVYFKTIFKVKDYGRHFNEEESLLHEQLAEERYAYCIDIFRIKVLSKMVNCTEVHRLYLALDLLLPCQKMNSRRIFAFLSWRLF